jgi:hypothetical protein
VNVVWLGAVRACACGEIHVNVAWLGAVSGYGMPSHVMSWRVHTSRLSVCSGSGEGEGYGSGHGGRTRRPRVRSGSN